MKKNGFTLIELLAVIVILAVIALITTVSILVIISDSKKNSFIASAYGISQAAKNEYIKTMYAGEEPQDIMYTFADGVETSNPEGYILEFEGGNPKTGQVALSADGNVALAIHDGVWCVTKGYTDAEVAISDSVAGDCSLPTP